MNISHMGVRVVTNHVTGGNVDLEKVKELVIKV